MSKSYSLSKISLAITLSIAGQSAFADINVADSNTQVSKNKILKSSILPIQVIQGFLITDIINLT